MPVEIAGKFLKPVFLIVGGKDNRTLVWMSEKIISLFPSSIKSELWIVENAGHGGNEAPEWVEMEKFVNKGVSFLND